MPIPDDHSNNHEAATAMNLTTPYGDELIGSVVVATALTAGHCVVALLVSCFIGTFVAILNTGNQPNKVTTLLRVMDAVGQFLPLLAVASALQIRSEFSVSLLLGAMTWNGLALFLSDEISSMRRSRFVEASRMLGASALHRVIYHILPTIMPRLVPMLIGLYISYAGLLGALGFLGVGSDPRHSLGFMIYDAKSYYQQSPTYFWASVVAFLFLTYFPMAGVWLVSGSTHLYRRRRVN